MTADPLNGNPAPAPALRAYDDVTAFCAQLLVPYNDPVYPPDDDTVPTMFSNDPSNVKLVSTDALGAVPFNVMIPLSVVPVSVNVPLVPDEPDDPELPLLPDEPDVPDDPLLPDVPELPLLPDVPSTPEVPLLPDDPDVPDEPDDPELPLVPLLPEEPLVPDVPLLPDVPDVPEVPAGVRAKFATSA